MADRPRHDAMAERESLMGRAMVEGLLGEAVIRQAYRKLPLLLEAKKQKVFQHNGEVVLGPEQEDWTEQRLAVEMVTKLADHWPNKLEHEVHGEVTFNVLGLDRDGV